MTKPHGWIYTTLRDVTGSAYSGARGLTRFERRVASSIVSEHLAWEIDSDGLKAVKLGDPRDDVRSVLGNFRSLKGPYDPDRDQFVSQGVQVVYDDESRAREIMVDVPAQARLKGVDLLGRSLDDVLADLAARGGAAIRHADGAVLPQMGISLYVVEGQVESVTIGYPPVPKPG